ncbi:restriction endonuclease subunit S [Clostridium sp. Sa3CUN1]|uniref:Restriction endonuclease subunit S n=1 Tax=Clostridium gallinarum TaxID=2762246 RepID=A0ABR8Q2P3_9CLOT|nr:restriction endonuclease subunit S [Clostridium gallinarum]MBD7914669.1 restriction endonuclease subunit S [Clostridium gallinarum]
MFGDIRELCTVSEYIISLTAGKSLAGETECKNKVLNTGSISYDYFDKTQVKNLPIDYIPKIDHLVNKGDVLISRMNTSELVGATAYVWNVDEDTYIPDRLWKANFKDNANPIFIWQLLIQRGTKEKIKRIASGTSGSMKNISKQGLLGIEVIKVNIDKQNEFANFVRQVDKMKLKMEKSLKELEENFNSLMQKAFKGELF